jgi:hypothetical protein
MVKKMLAQVGNVLDKLSMSMSLNVNFVVINCIEC